MSTCDEACINNGITFLRSILHTILVSAYGGTIPAAEVEARLRFALNTLNCNLQPPLVDQITSVRDASIRTISQVNTAYIVVIFVTFFLLVILNYVAMLFNSQTVTIVMFVLSILIIFIAGFILYIWLQSIYNTAGQDIINIVDNIVNAVQESFCCLGAPCNGGSSCISCNP